MTVPAPQDNDIRRTLIHSRAISLMLSIILAAGVTWTWCFGLAGFAKRIFDSNKGFAANTRDAPKNASSTKIRPILFLHFHKSGGSEACTNMHLFQNQVVLTNENGTEVEEKALHNCNAMFAGPNSDRRIQNPSETLTCHDLYNRTTDERGVPFQRNNYLALETPLNDVVVFGNKTTPSLPCNGFRIFGLMRQPVQRFQSHMAQHQWNASLVWKALDNKSSMTGQLPSRNHGMPRFVDRVYPTLNCMVIRMLLGAERFLDVRKVNREDFRRAKRIVDSIWKQGGIIVPTERQLGPRVLQILKERIPEYHLALQNRYSNGEHNDGITAYHPEAGFLKLLQEQNKFDVLLYQYIHQKLGIGVDSKP